MSALHLQIAIYLYFVAAFCMIAVLSLLGKADSRLLRFSSSIMFFGVALVAIGWHAGRDLPRTEAELFWGDRQATLVHCPLPRLGIKLTGVDCDRYRSLLELVEQHSEAGGRLLTVPSSIEVNFLSGRVQPVPWMVCPMGLHSAEALTATLELLTSNPAEMIVVEPADKYFSKRCRSLVEELIPLYREIDAPKGFRVFILNQFPKEFTERSCPGERCASPPTAQGLTGL